MLPACNGIIIEALRRLFTLAVVIAAVFVLVHVWTNKGLDRHQLPGPKIIEIDPGKNIP